MKAPQVTIIAAVWSKDPNRWALIEKHQENVTQQSKNNLELIYILENNDTPPSWARDHCYIHSHPLSIYQAWDLGIKLSRSEFIMNLNIDDRLRSNAVEQLLLPFRDESILCVGGEWEIVFQLDGIFSAKYIETTNGFNYHPDWPPIPGRGRQILGSGNGLRGTLGPATLWRKTLFDTIDMPTTFGNGEAIKSIGDAIFWNLIKLHFPRSIFRIPLIIGDYYSHPESQAEFRSHNEEEILKKVGIKGKTTLKVRTT